MTVFDSLIPTTDDTPAPGDRPENENASVCQGWLCSYLRESYTSIPGAGKSGDGLAPMGSCPVHTWY